MKTINECTIKEGNDFIRMWNQLIARHGHVTESNAWDLAEICGYDGEKPCGYGRVTESNAWDPVEICDYNGEKLCQNTELGWTYFITTDNLIVIKTVDHYIFRLNLPELREL